MDHDTINRRAEFARTLKASPLFADMVSDTQSRIATDWAIGQTTEVREAQHAKLTGLNEFVLTLRSWIDAGTLAAAKHAANEATDSQPS